MRANAYTCALDTWISKPATGKTAGMLIDDMETYIGLLTQYGDICNLYLGGGTLNQPFTGYYQYDKLTALPNDLTRSDGAVFEGWYAEPDFSGTPVVGIYPQTRGELTYYAKWSGGKGGAIVADLGGGSADGLPQYFTRGEEQTIELPTPVLTDHVFGGWYDNADFAGEPLSSIHITADRTADVYLYAKWCYLSIDYGFQDKTADPDTAVTIQENNMDFVAPWNSEKGDFFLIANPADPDDIIMRAVYRYQSDVSIAGAFRVTVNTGNGTNLSGDPVYTFAFSVARDAALPLADLKLVCYDGSSGYPQPLSIEGGYLKVNGTAVAQIGESFSRITLVCDRTTGDFTVYLNGAQVGTGTNEQMKMLSAFQMRIHPNGNQDGALLLDDFYLSEGSYPAAYPTVSYVLGTDAATLAAGIKSYGAQGSTLTLPVPTWDGVEFLGWYDNPACTGEALTEVRLSDKNITLYAKWSRVPIQYKLNGYGSMPEGGFDAYVEDGATEITLPDLADTSKRVFLGWCTDASCKGTVYNGTYSDPDGISTSMTFYAKWITHFEADMSQERPFPDDWLDYESTKDSSDPKVGVHFTVENGYILINKEKVDGMRDGQMSAVGLSALSAGTRGIITIELALSAVAGQPVVGMDLHTRYSDTAVFSVQNGTGKLFVGGVEVGVLGEEEVLVTLVLDLENSKMDAYLDGVQYLDGYAYTNKSTVSGFNRVRLYFQSGFSGQLKVHKFAFSEGEEFTYTEPAGEAMAQVTLIDGGKTTVTWESAGAYTLPEGKWLDGEGNLVEGEVAVSGISKFYKVDVDLLVGASVRLNDPAGLRFESTISKALYDALMEAGYTVTFGTYIFPADEYKDGVMPEDAVCSVFTDVAQLSEANGVYTYYTSLVNLLDQNYARAFGAISYLTVSRGEEEPYTFKTDYTPEDNARSVYEVAKAVAKEGELSGLSAEQQAVVTGYLDAVVEIADGAAVAIANYTSPYTVTVEEGKLTVTGAVTAIKAVIVDGTVYTRGWSVEGETLSATLPAASEEPEAPQG